MLSWCCPFSPYAWEGGVCSCPGHPVCRGDICPVSQELPQVLLCFSIRLPAEAIGTGPGLVGELQRCFSG